MRQKPPARVSTPSLTSQTVGSLTTYPRFPTRHKLHSWPGDYETFDNVDEEEFDDWDGTEDLPGLRTLHIAAINLRVYESNRCRHTSRPY
jgi:hypothetical protein